ncbi:MAG: hypothetical protein ACM3X6_00440 [Patescibacteria group bacterium]
MSPDHLLLSENTTVAELLSSYPFLRGFLLRLAPGVRLGGDYREALSLGGFASLGGLCPRRFMRLVAREIRRAGSRREDGNPMISRRRV